VHIVFAESSVEVVLSQRVESKRVEMDAQISSLIMAANLMSEAICFAPVISHLGNIPDETDCFDTGLDFLLTFLILPR
jgi:hypothetical protein